MGAVGPRGGKADVYIDGVKQLAYIDFWNPRELAQQTVYYRNGLPQGEHTVRIVARSDRNPMSQGHVSSPIDAVMLPAAQGENGFGSGGGLHVDAAHDLRLHRTHGLSSTPRATRGDPARSSSCEPANAPTPWRMPGGR